METNDIAQYLDALKREECYRVDAVLKESAAETTQRVSFIGANGAESGPFIRKFIQRESGMGSAYELIYAAQQAGKRFKYVPRIMECYSRGDQIAVVMEYVRGETLQDYVYYRGPSVLLAKSVFPQICDAVAELHEGFAQPIIHRDLKPSNIILSDGGLAIIDFGIAREYKSNAEVDTVHFGTREFAPPEQFGFGQTSVRSDVYALGMVLFFCLTEKIPTASIREAGFRDERIPEPLRAVIAQATAFAPENRFKSARALKAAFANALALCDSGGSVARDVPPTSVAAEPPASSKPPESSGRQPKKSKLSARNIATLVITGFFLVVDFSVLVSPPANVAQHPFWYNFIAFGLVGPLIIIALGYTCAGKENLSARFPQLARVRSWHLWVVAVVALFLGAAVSLALGYEP